MSHRDGEGDRRYRIGRVAQERREGSRRRLMGSDSGSGHSRDLDRIGRIKAACYRVDRVPKGRSSQLRGAPGQDRVRVNPVQSRPEPLVGGNGDQRSAVLAKWMSMSDCRLAAGKLGHLRRTPR